MKRDCTMNDYKEKESPLVTGQTFIKYFYTIMPLDHADVNAHWHQHMELILIAKGSIPITLENATITAKKGDLLIIAPNCLHEWHCDSAPVEYHCIQLNIERLLNQTSASSKNLLPIMENNIEYIPLISDSTLNNHIEELIYLQNTSPDSLYTLSKIFYILAYLNEHCVTKSHIYISDERIAKILKYINAHFNEKLSTKILSEQFSYSESYLCRRFKTVTGVTIKRYILIYRLDKASHLLCDTEYDIGEISIKCGFSDFSYFSSNFKKRFKYTPSEYRKMIKKD